MYLVFCGYSFISRKEYSLLDSMYDAVIVGAGISGSVCAKILAENDYRVILVDREIPPRDKVCSGVQLNYMEKIIGKRIPEEVLCRNKLRRVHLETPSGKALEGNMSLLNYWRRKFDFWLNKLAIDAGADTLWGSAVSDIKVSGDSVSLKVGNDEIKSRYILRIGMEDFREILCLSNAV